MKEIELEYDDHTLFICDIEEVSDEIDYEFAGVPGVHTTVGCDVHDLRVVTYINGIDFDVTSSIKELEPKMYELFKEWAQQEYIDKYIF